MKWAHDTDETLHREYTFGTKLSTTVDYKQELISCFRTVELSLPELIRW